MLRCEIVRSWENDGAMEKGTMEHPHDAHQKSLQSSLGILLFSPFGRSADWSVAGGKATTKGAAEGSEQHEEALRATEPGQLKEEGRDAGNCQQRVSVARN